MARIRRYSHSLRSRAMKELTADDLIYGIKGMSESDMISKCEEFLKDVESTVCDKDGNIIKPPFGIVPTFSAFADYIQQSRADMHEWVRLHPVAAQQMRDMVADTIAAGAMRKAYEPRIATFALKNWCGWEEQPQKKDSKSKDVADEKKAANKLKEYMAAERRLKVV